MLIIDELRRRLERQSKKTIDELEKKLSDSHNKIEELKKKLSESQNTNSSLMGALDKLEAMLSKSETRLS